MSPNDEDWSSLLQTILDYLPSGVSLLDKDLRLVAWNEEFRRLLCFPDELFESPAPDLYDLLLFNARRGEYGPGDPEAQARAGIERARRMEPHLFERTRPDGTVIEVRGRPLPGGGFVTIYSDVTVRRRAEEEVRRTASFLQAVLDSLPFGTMVVDSDIRCTYWNRQSEALFDFPPGFIRQGLPVEEVVRQVARSGIYGPGDVEEQVAARMQQIGRLLPHSAEMIRLDGRSLRVIGSPVMLDGRAQGLIILQEDITERIHHESMLQRLATTDALTGLLNRRAFLEAVEREIGRARRDSLPLALLMFDVDHFKRVNDRYGHPAGDEVLRRLAATCRDLLRDEDLVGRLGGEEFAVLLIHPHPQSAALVAERLREAVQAQAIDHAGRAIAVTVSLGIAELGEGIDSVEQLISRADACLYTAKRTGRNRVCHAPAQGG